MRPILARPILALILVLAPALARAAEPRAELHGPTTAVIGERVLFDVAGSASDSALQVDAVGPEKPTLKLWYDEAKRPGLLVVTPTRPGLYTVVVVAIGKAEGSDTATVRVATGLLDVTLPQPAPNPIPGPTPGPGPEPPPPVPPGPGPVVTGKLWAVYLTPDLPSPAEAALRTSPTLRAQFDGTTTFFRSYLASEPEVAAKGWTAVLAAAGGPPAVFWVGETGKIYRTTKAPTEAAIVSDLKTLRGTK